MLNTPMIQLTVLYVQPNKVYHAIHNGGTCMGLGIESVGGGGDFSEEEVFAVLDEVESRDGGKYRTLLRFLATRPRASEDDITEI
jgi:hypothetical protein